MPARFWISLTAVLLFASCSAEQGDGDTALARGDLGGSSTPDPTSALPADTSPSSASPTSESTERELPEPVGPVVHVTWIEELVGRPLFEKEVDRIVAGLNAVYGTNAESLAHLGEEPWFGPGTPATRRAVVDALLGWEAGATLEVPVSGGRIIQIDARRIEAVLELHLITQQSLRILIEMADVAGLWDEDLGELFWQPLVGLLRSVSDAEILAVADAGGDVGSAVPIEEIAAMAARHRAMLDTYVDPGLAMIATAAPDLAARVFEDLTVTGLVSGLDAMSVQSLANSTGHRSSAEWRDALISAGDFRFIFVADDLVSATPDWLDDSGFRVWPQRDQSGLDRASCSFDGVFLGGRAQVVETRADFDIRITDGASTDVRVVEAARSPSGVSSCGVWWFVTDSPDFTVRWVDRFEDFAIGFVDRAPGTG